jgi:hypothetical protein
MDHRTSEGASASSGHPAVPMLDLQPFCSTDEARWYLTKPFSRDGFTWATNGHILVRVPLRGNIPDIDKKFNQAKPIEGIETANFFTPHFNLPPAPSTSDPCPKCEGRGSKHDCPECDCECETCDGRGDLDPERIISTRIGATIYSLFYVRQMFSLPNVELSVAEAKPDEKPLLFRFDGGVGALMPMRREAEQHIEIEPRKD